MSESFTRRLPVYLVLDTSGSMAGEAIEACHQGLKALLADLRCDPQALETAYLSVIVFNSGAQQVAPLAEVGSFAEPSLVACGGTSYGAALRLLGQCIDREVRKSSPTQKGDWKPLVFLMTDGMPTDCGWEEEAAAIRGRKLNCIACAAGPGADKACLQKLTETVIELSSLQPEQLRAFFAWVSASVKAASVRVEKPATAATGAALPPLPGGLVIVP